MLTKNVCLQIISSVTPALLERSGQSTEGAASNFHVLDPDQKIRVEKAYGVYIASPPSSKAT